MLLLLLLLWYAAVMACLLLNYSSEQSVLNSCPALGAGFLHRMSHVGVDGELFFVELDQMFSSCSRRL